MRITSAGDVGIGTTSPSQHFQISGTSEQFISSVSTNGANAGVRMNSSGNRDFGIFSDGSLRFYDFTASAERARITSGGNLLVGTTNASQASGIGVKILPTGACYTVGTGIDCFSYYNTSGSQYRFYVGADGGIANFSGLNTNLSDRREKKNFAPAKSYLDVICSIPVQTFNYIGQDLEQDAGLTLGVVAQDVQAVAPELVTESNWGTKEDPKMRLSIYQTDLQYALMKCIQEQQTLITQLTARITALEGA